MSQSDSDKALAAEERSQHARSFVRRVRSATRRKYSPEEKTRIVLEGFRREVTVNDLSYLSCKSPLVAPLSSTIRSRLRSLSYSTISPGVSRRAVEASARVRYRIGT